MSTTPIQGIRLWARKPASGYLLGVIAFVFAMGFVALAFGGCAVTTTNKVVVVSPSMTPPAAPNHPVERAMAEAQASAPQAGVCLPGDTCREGGNAACCPNGAPILR